MSNKEQNILSEKPSDELIKKAQDNLSKKHLIIHGDPMSGKSLLIRLLLKNTFYSTVDLFDRFEFPNTFDWRLGKSSQHDDYLLFNDLSSSFAPNCFTTFCSGSPIKINSFGVKPFFIAPIIILEYKEELSEAFLFGGSVRRRFNVINTNTISYKEIIQFIKEWNNNEALS